MSTETIGTYRIVQKLGAGGQATAWLAEEPETDEKVLVKVFHVELAEDWKIAELFERSSRVLEAIEHPNIPAYRDHFEIEEGHTVKLCLVRDFVAGDSLQDLIDEGGSFSEEEVIELAIDLLETLEYLHSLDPPVIHRDIKPANIILGPERKPYLVDFGAVQAEVMSETGGSTVVGTAGYVAPEQLMGRAQPSSDIYALGVTLVHLLTRKAPTELRSNGFELDFSGELHASPQLTYVIGRMTRADIDERDDSAKDLLEKFRTLASGGEIVVRSSTLPVKVPAGSQLEVVETANSIVVRTPSVLTWDSSRWKRFFKLGVLWIPAIIALIVVIPLSLSSPGFAAAALGTALLIYLVFQRLSRPLAIELGADWLQITQPLIRQQPNGEMLQGSDKWTPYISRKETRVPYDKVHGIDFVPIEFGGLMGSNRVMRLNCSSKTSLAPVSSGFMIDVDKSNSYLLNLGLTQGEEIWLANLINARIEQYREMKGEES